MNDKSRSQSSCGSTTLLNILLKGSGQKVLHMTKSPNRLLCFNSQSNLKYLFMTKSCPLTTNPGLNQSSRLCIAFCPGRIKHDKQNKCRTFSLGQKTLARWWGGGTGLHIYCEISQDLSATKHFVGFSVHKKRKLQNVLSGYYSQFPLVLFKQLKDLRK